MRRFLSIAVLAAAVASAAPSHAGPAFGEPSFRRVYRGTITAGAYRLDVDAWSSEPDGTLSEKGVASQHPFSWACATLRRGTTSERACGAVSMPGDHMLVYTHFAKTLTEGRVRLTLDVSFYSNGMNGPAGGQSLTPGHSTAQPAPAVSATMSLTHPAVVEATVRSARLGGFVRALGTGTMARQITVDAVA